MFSSAGDSDGSLSYLYSHHSLVVLTSVAFPGFFHPSLSPSKDESPILEGRVRRRGEGTDIFGHTRRATRLRSTWSRIPGFTRAWVVELRVLTTHTSSIGQEVFLAEES